MIPLEEGIITIRLVTSFSIYTRENPEEKNLISTELKQYVYGSSKSKSSFNSYFASISPLQTKNWRFSYD